MFDTSLSVILIAVHTPAAYIFALIFPLYRWWKLRAKNQTINIGICIHQAATGFVLPAFIMLLFSYADRNIVNHVSGHELGVAGLIALITSLREIAVDGMSDHS